MYCNLFVIRVLVSSYLLLLLLLKCACHDNLMLCKSQEQTFLVTDDSIAGVTSLFRETRSNTSVLKTVIVLKIQKGRQNNHKSKFLNKFT